MHGLLENIVAYKKYLVKNLEVKGERTRRIHRLKDYLNKSINIIAEIKEKSPSAGHIKRIDVRETVERYKRFASAISVLTDEKFFSGSFDRLRLVADMVDLPVLCKDFIIDKKQIDLAYVNGADIVLLIVRILDEKRLLSLFNYALSLGMDVLVEIHSSNEIPVALGLKKAIVGVNARDLDTLEVSLDRAKTLLKQIPAERIRVAESGIKTKQDIESLKPYCNAFLIGEALLKNRLSFDETEVS